MAEQACQKRHHGPRHAGHFDQKPEENEQRYREQDQMAHALVHPPDQHHQRRPRRQREISENRKTKRERDRHAGEDTEADHADEEDYQVEIAERPQPRRRQPENGNQQRHRQRRPSNEPVSPTRSQSENRKQHHQADADR